MKRFLVTAVCGGLLAAPQLTFAEQGAIEEVIVTATRREESIQDVPIAVSAFNGEDLAARGVTDLYGLQEVSPSVSVYGSNSNSGASSVRIRGIGTTGNNPGLEAAVGTFIDGVYRSRFGQAMADLVDVERIEILRGPQGTLFGKNTSAGAINIITKKPEFEQSGHVEVGGGELGTFKANASITGPMSETLAYRLSASYHERDGTLENVDTGKEYDIRDRWSVKGQLLWNPATTSASASLLTTRNETKTAVSPLGSLSPQAAGLRTSMPTRTHSWTRAPGKPVRTSTASRTWRIAAYRWKSSTTSTRWAPPWCR